MTESNQFEKLAAIDVSKRIEKKNGMSYLSWAWAVDQLLRRDPAANWSYPEPKIFADGTQMVYCSVTAFGKTMTGFLPVMDFRNKPIAAPNAFDINTAMQRCLVKTIALHGLGLYIYAGEDVPMDPEPIVVQPQLPDALLEEATLAALDGMETYQKFFASLTPAKRKQLKPKHEELKATAMGVSK
jgi:hypothetical protein